jgi:hypothetical protein
VKDLQLQERMYRRVRIVLVLGVSAAIPVSGLAQTVEHLDAAEKLHLHAKRAFGPSAIVRSAARAGLQQRSNSPEEWGQGATAYGKRFGSAVAQSSIRNALAFGLDSTLHQDPRYFRLGGAGLWRRSVHAVRGTMLTRTDSGGETVSTWRIGSAYGTAFLANQWQPDRINRVRLGFQHGSITLAFDLISSLGSEFWPDIKKTVFRRK